MDQGVHKGEGGELVMLPFHKRARANSSIEIGTDEFEAIELPHVRPPSVRPSAFIAAPAGRPMYSFNDEEEMTVIRPDKRQSSAPPRHAGRSSQMPRIPAPPPAPRFDDDSWRRPAFDGSDDEPTMLLTSSSRPLLSMSARNVIVEPEAYNQEIPPPPPSSRARVTEPPQSAAAVDANASGVLRDLSMTSSLADSTDVRRMRGGRGAVFGAGLIAVGVLAGLVVAFVARGEGIAAAAALIDPSHTVTADVAKAVPATQSQAMAPGAAVTQQQASDKAGAGSCNADAVAAAVVAKVEAHGTQHMEVSAPPKAVEAKPIVSAPVVAYAAPRAVVHHVEQPREPAQVAVAAVAAPPPPVVAKPAAKTTKRDEMESASAADALAKAQLEASLSR
jgi:hypothetical protein